MRVFKSIAAKRRTRKKFGGDQSSLFQAHGSDGLLSRKFQVKESLVSRRDSDHIRVTVCGDRESRRGSVGPNNGGMEARH